MRLRGKLGGGYEIIDDKEVDPGARTRDGKYMIAVTGSRILPGPIEEWVVRNCPQVKEFALTGYTLKLRKDSTRPNRHLLAFCVAAHGVAQSEAETALSLALQRLKPKHRPKKLVWVSLIPKVHPDQGGGYDRMRLAKKTQKDEISDARFNGKRETSLYRGKGSRLKTPSIKGARNQWSFEGFLKYHPTRQQRESENREMLTMVLAHVDEQTREERQLPVLVTKRPLIGKCSDFKRGDRVNAVGIFGPYGRHVCVSAAKVSGSLVKIPLDDIDQVAEALVR